MDLEKIKLEVEERQRRDDRQCQFSMTHMIMGVVGHKPVQGSSATNCQPMQ